MKGSEWTGSEEAGGTATDARGAGWEGMESDGSSGYERPGTARAGQQRRQRNWLGRVGKGRWRGAAEAVSRMEIERARAERLQSRGS